MICAGKMTHNFGDESLMAFPQKLVDAMKTYTLPSVIDVVAVNLTVYGSQNVILFFDETLTDIQDLFKCIASMIISGLLHLAKLLVAVGYPGLCLDIHSRKLIE
jgi:hypothetical protein